MFSEGTVGNSETEESALEGMFSEGSVGRDGGSMVPNSSEEKSAVPPISSESLSD
jgi:hypothetical protein